MKKKAQKKSSKKAGRKAVRKKNAKLLQEIGFDGLLKIREDLSLEDDEDSLLWSDEEDETQKAPEENETQKAPEEETQENTAAEEQPDGEKLNPIRIKEYLDKTVCSQEEAKISLSMALYNHLLGRERGEKLTNETTILIGPTGCGKTMLARALAEYAGLPVMEVDASQITQDGFKGMNKDAIFSALLDKTDDIEKAEWGIVVLDEFDKLTRPSYDSRGANVSALAQGCILGMLDGTPVYLNHGCHGGMSFETKNILYIMTGAFDNIAQANKRKKKKEIGFAAGSTAQEEDEDSPDELYSHENIRRDLEKAGLLPELIGRITNIAFVRALDGDELYDVVMEKDGALMKKYSEALEHSGKKLVIDEESIRNLARESAGAGLGVRGLRNLISEKLRAGVFESYARGRDEVYL